MRWDLLAAVAAGGALGAPARVWLDRAVSSRSASDLPIGTMLVNVSGSLLLGVLTGLVLTGHLSPLGRAAAATGFCGAYTTFSTFTYESVFLLEEGRILEALGTIGLSLVLGLAAAAAGLALGLHL